MAAFIGLTLGFGYQGLAQAGAETAQSPLPKDSSSPVVPKAEAEAAALKEQAVDIAREIAEAYPSNSLAYALLGAASYNSGRSAEATKYLQKCLELDPAQADAYQILARIAYEKGDLGQCVGLCRKALRNAPANAEILDQLGRALMDMGQTEEAIQTLAQASQLPDASSQSFYLLGQANLQAGNYAQAKESLKRAIALLPDHTQAYFALYRACQRLGQAEEAQRYREQFVKLESIDRRALTQDSAQEDTLTGLPMVRNTVARTFFGAAQVYHVQQQPAKEADLLKRACSLDAGNAVYRSALEAHYVQNKALAEGAALFEQLASEQPTNHLNFFFLGRLRARLGQAEPAAAAYRKVQQLAPNWAEGFRALADLELRTNGDPGEAQSLARRAAELEPTGPHYYLLAVASVKNNDRASALAALQQAVTLAPQERRYRDLLQQLSQSQ